MLKQWHYFLKVCLLLFSLNVYIKVLYQKRLMFKVKRLNKLFTLNISLFLTTTFLTLLRSSKKVTLYFKNHGRKRLFASRAA